MPRGKKEELLQEEEMVMEWSKKRVVTGFIISLVLAGGMYFFVSTYLFNHLSGTGLGPKSQNSNIVTPPMNSLSQKDIDKVISQVQSQIQQITPQNLLSSQAAITKLISDLKKLQNGKESPKDAVCSVVCK